MTRRKVVCFTVMVGLMSAFASRLLFGYTVDAQWQQFGNVSLPATFTGSSKFENFKLIRSFSFIPTASATYTVTFEASTKHLVARMAGMTFNKGDSKTVSFKKGSTYTVQVQGATGGLSQGGSVDDVTPAFASYTLTIGGGGGGGGGGGAGGNGGRRWTTATTSSRHPTGAGGEKGYENGNGHDRTARQYFEDATDSDRSWGGYGGKGGSQGAKGSLEGFYRDSTYTKFTGNADSTTAVSSHTAIEYRMRFNESYLGGRSSTNLAVKLGYPLPTTANGVYKPSRSKYIFLGWYAEQYGDGDCYYDRYLNPGLSGFSYIGDKTIYGYWTRDDDIVWVNGVGITAGVDKSGDGWSYKADDSTLSLTGKDKTFVINGKDEYGEITINVAANCSVVASNLTVDAIHHRGRSAFRVSSGAKATLSLVGDNDLRGGTDAPAVQVEKGSALTISGEGRLIATSGLTGEFDHGSAAAAIGSRPGNAAGEITIAGGRITATSGGGAGIGGGAGGSDGVLSVTGGYVVATGGRNESEDEDIEALFSADIGPGYDYANTTYSVKSTVDPGNAYLAPYNFRLACSKTNIGPMFYSRDGLPLYCVAFTGLVANVTAEISGIPSAYLPPYEINTTDNGAVYLWLPSATEKYDVAITADGETLRYIVRVDGAHVAAPFASGLRVNGRDVLLSYGPGWTLDETKGIVNLDGAGPFLIDGGAPGMGLSANVGCSVVLSNVTIDANWPVAKPGFSIKDGTAVEMMIAGSNKLRGGNCFAGIYVGSGSGIVLDGKGSLEAKGYFGGAGIGGSLGSPDWGRIEIKGGNVTAVGNSYLEAYGAAGIGGGPGGKGGSIFISGGSIKATGGRNGAGIGSGSLMGTNGVETASWGTGGIEISGDNTVIDATGGRLAAGIGGGNGMSGGVLKISGGTITALGGGVGIGSGADVGWGAGIGGGQYADGGEIEISGGNVASTGGTGAAGIGGGFKGNAGVIKLSTGRIKATGGEQAAGIGVGASTGSGGGEISILSGTITATGGNNGGNQIGTAFSAESTTGVLKIVGGAVGVTYLNPSPLNSSSVKVYALDIECEKPGLLVTNLYLSTATYYGFEGAYTDSKGMLRVWIPSTSGKVEPGHIALEDGTSIDFQYAVTNGGSSYFGYIIYANNEQVFSAMDMTGTGWSYTRSSHVLLLNDAGTPVTLSGLSRDGAFKVVVPDGGAEEVTFDGFSIISSENRMFDSPVVISNACKLVLKGENVAWGKTSYSAGIEVVDNAMLTIAGDGELKAYGGKYAAGIGSGGSNASLPPTPGRIVIESGNVYATGGESAAGVGGGSMCNLREDGILVKGGRVNAYGGKSAAGLGAGHGQFIIPDNAVKIIAGTVAAYGDWSNPSTTSLSSSKSLSDFVASLGNTVDTTTLKYKSLVITGGSAVPEVVGKALPYPVGPDGRRVRSIMLVGLEPDESAKIVSTEVPSYYSTDDIYADADGRVCLWLYPTNHARSFTINGVNFETPYPYTNSVTRPVYDVDVVVTGRTDVVIGDKTCYIVKVSGLAKNATVSVSGLPDLDGTQLETSSVGVIRLYLPNGDYRFRVDGATYMARVEDGPATAIRAEPDTPVGVRVNGEDVAPAIGDGWIYDMTTSSLVLSAAALYEISGSNTEGKVAITVTDAATLSLSNLTIAAKSPFSFSKPATLRGEGFCSLSATSGHVLDGAGPISVERGSFALKGDVSCPVKITGGSLKLDGNAAFAFSNGTERVWRVTMGGFQPNLTVGTITGLDGYDVDGIVADEQGKIYLWLPSGGYNVSIDALGFVFVVDGADLDVSTARIGVMVDGVDIAGGHGTGWEYSIADHTLNFNEEMEFTVSGTNVQGWVSIAVNTNATLKVKDINLDVGSNGSSAISVKKGCSLNLKLDGENNLVASGSSVPAILVPSGAALEISGTGTMVAKGGSNAASIGGAYKGACGAIIVSDGTLFSTSNGRFVGRGLNGTNGSVAIKGGSVAMKVSQANPAAEDGYSHPVWPVTVGGFSPNTRVTGIVGLDDYGINGIVADSDGKIYLWLPDGRYEFEAAGKRYFAMVSGNATEAIEPFSVRVNGSDIFDLSGTGWSFNTQSGILSLEQAMEYVVDGTNMEGKVRISASHGASLVFSNLCLRAVEPLAVEGSVILRGKGANALSANGNIAIAGDGGVLVSNGTFLVSGNVACSLTVLGGSLRLSGFSSVPISNATERVHCVTVAGLVPGEKVGGISGIGEYGTDEIFADGGGSIYLWLPDGEYEFYAGGLHLYAKVDGYDVIAVKYEEALATGVLVDGVDAILLAGEGWTYDKTTYILTLAAGAERVVSGTNTEGRVMISADAGAHLVLSNLCIAASSPITANGELSIRGSGMNRLGSTSGSVLGGAGPVRFECGTFALSGDTECPVVVTGGSLKLEGSAHVAFSNDIERVWCVTVEGFNPGAAIMNMDGLAGYGASGLVADDEGAIYLWLPNGYHSFAADGQDYAVYVKNAPANAVKTAPLALTGVFVDSVDVCCGAGDGWCYYRAESNLVFTSATGQTVSGTNLEGAVSIAVQGDGALSMSNLRISAAEPLTAEGEVVLNGIGQNEIVATKWSLLAGNGNFVFQNGTFLMEGPALTPVSILGGSVGHEGSALFAFSNAVERVWHVQVGGFVPGKPVAGSGEIPGYSLDGLFADGEGLLHLWLPNGYYDFHVDGRRYIASVLDEDTQAVDWEDSQLMHVTIDGTDASNGPGTGWAYDPSTSNLTFTLGGAYALAGGNMDGVVRIVAESNTTFVMSSLYLFAETPITANGEISLRSTGESIFEAFPGSSIFDGTNTVTILGGTFSLIGDITSPFKITGGSVWHDGTVAGTALPIVSNATDRVWCVTVGLLGSGSEVHDLTVDGLSYDTNGIQADKDGNAYLWLPDGEYNFHAGERSWHAIVDGTNAIAEATFSVPLVSNFLASSGEVKMSVPIESVADAISAARSRKGLLMASARSIGGLRIYSSTVLPFPDQPHEVDLSECEIIDNKDGTATVRLKLSGSEPSMFYKIER